MSALGEPLKAEVDLVAEKNEAGSLAVRLASPDAFERAGLAYSTLLTSVKVSIEKRANGEPYVKLTSSQPVAEPFLDLLIELTWSSGRISREFTALLDPPSVIAEREKQQKAAAEVRAAPTAPEPKPEPVPAPTAEAAKPEAEAAKPVEPAAPATAEPAAQPPADQAPTEAAKTEPAPAAPVETIGGSQPTLLNEGSALPGGTKTTPAADAYGPVKSGDTLGKIASATKPANVSLEQMLVLLTQKNPDAFSGKNMNRLKTGKILQLPTSEQLAGMTEVDAKKEVKLQARDWRAYRDQLAASAGQAPAEEQPAQQAASGKVGAGVDSKSAAPKDQPKEVLKLSKNEPAAGAAGGDAKSAARVHALEEEVVARDKAVKESSERVAKLEKQIKDLQSLLEMKNKGMAELQKPAATPPATVPPAPAPKPAPQAAAPVTPAAPTPPAPEVKPTTPAPVAPAPPSPKSEGAPAPSQPAPAQPKPAPVKTAPMPAPEPSMMDQVLDQPAYLGGAIGVLIIIGALAVRAVKRRRESKSDAEESGPARAFAENPGPAYAGAASVAGKGDASTKAEKESSEEVDPLAEAEIFLAYGRDAQAEELLKEALQNSPKRYEIHLKLLQIYANRKDAKSFEKVARDLQQASGGAGEIWDQAIALGYQVDPDNSRYAAGRSAAGAAATAGAAAAASAAAENVDFNIGSEDSQATTTDIDLGDSSFDSTQIIDPAAEPAHDATVSMRPAAMDFNVDLPAAGVSADELAPRRASSAGLDFDIDLNSLTSSAPADAGAAAAEPASGGLDFDMSGLSLDAPAEPRLESSSAAPEIDLSGISLDLGTETTPALSPTGKDDHWYDVQTKFDLAKAYQEMGDKDGAREILKEVLQEGDAEQKTAAKSVLSSLDT